MKILALIVLCVACANASKLSNLFEKLVPSFITGYVIHGQEADPNSAPFIVSLSAKANRHNHICGATLINKDWLVTAAHCISKAEGMGAVAGLHYLKDKGDHVQSREVDFGLVHPLYPGKVGPYDIAILHVSKSFEFTERVQPATLPSTNSIPEGETILFGWGQTKPFSFSAAKVLQTIQTPIVPMHECKELLPENAPIHESNICSDSQQKGISACNGDSGGPLVQKKAGAPTELIGVVSWGYIPCGMANLPSIFTRVSAHIEWLNRVQSSYYTLYNKQ